VAEASLWSLRPEQLLSRLIIESEQ
jgi:hypothetical protein